MADARSERLRVAVRWLTVAVLTVVFVIPFLGNRLRVADVDPQFMRDLIERAHRFGGTFYENGIYNKGVLEPFVYNLGRHLGGYDGMWLTISIFAAIAAAACFNAAAACRLASKALVASAPEFRDCCCACAASCAPSAACRIASSNDTGGAG